MPNKPDDDKPTEAVMMSDDDLVEQLYEALRRASRGRRRLNVELEATVTSHRMNGKLFQKMAGK